MSKGEQTRDRIVDLAFRLATRDGLGGLSLGKLAGELGVSKSGLFAHFGSKADLELEILKTAQARFIEAVLKPSFQAPRGLPRLRVLFENWLAWIRDPGRPGGCLFLAAAIEFDDEADGPLRDYVVSMQSAMLATVSKTVSLAVSEGHLHESLDGEQLAFEMLGIAHAYHLAKRLLRDPRAEARALAAFESRLELARKKNRA